MTHPIDERFKKEAAKLHRMPPPRVWRKLEARLDRADASALRWMQRVAAAAVLALMAVASFYVLSWQRTQRPVAEIGKWEELTASPTGSDQHHHASWARPSLDAAPLLAQSYLESRQLLLRTEAARRRVQVTEGATIGAALRLLGWWEGEQVALLLHQRGAAVMAWIAAPARLSPLFRIEGNLFIFEGSRPPLATRLEYDERADGFVELSAIWLGEVTLRFHPHATEWLLRCRRHTAWYEVLSQQLGPGKIQGELVEWRFHKGTS